jgi:hypothetical protein
MVFLYGRFLPEWRCGQVESRVVRVYAVAVERECPRVGSWCRAVRIDCRANMDVV